MGMTRSDAEQLGIAYLPGAEEDEIEAAKHQGMLDKGGGLNPYLMAAGKNFVRNSQGNWVARTRGEGGWDEERADEFTQRYQKYLDAPEGVRSTLYGTQGYLAPASIFQGAGGANALIDPVGGFATPEHAAAREALAAKYPGYAQVGNMVRGVDESGMPIFPSAGPSVGDYVIDPTQVTHDPEFGFITPLSNLGRAGEKGGFVNRFADEIGMALKLGSVAAPFAISSALGAPIGGVAGIQPSTSAILKGAGAGMLTSLATGGNPVEGAIMGLTLAPAKIAAGKVVEDLASEGFSKVAQKAAEGVALGAQRGLASGHPLGVVTGALTGGLTGAAGEAAGGMFDDVKEAAPEPPVEDVADGGDAARTSASDLPRDSRGLMFPGRSSPMAEDRLREMIGASPQPGGVDITPVPVDFYGSEAGGLFTPAPSAPSAAPRAPTALGGGPLAVEDAPAAEEDLSDRLVARETIGYAKLAKSVYDVYEALTGEKSTVQEFQAPARQANESDEDYSGRVVGDAVDYIDTRQLESLGLDISALDVRALAAQGFTPGTPEYLGAILTGIDDLIQQLVGVDPDVLLEGETAGDLQEQFRGKTNREMQALQRALFARGALDSLSFSDRAVDPFTGVMEEFGESGPVRGSTAAYQRGLARTGRDIGDRGGEALREFLGRETPDLFGLQRAADERRKRDHLMAALMSATGDDRRRGRVGAQLSPDFWAMLQEDPGLMSYLMRGVA